MPSQTRARRSTTASRRWRICWAVRPSTDARTIGRRVRIKTVAAAGSGTLGFGDPHDRSGRYCCKSP
jgi:hypothetical protein